MPPRMDVRNIGPNQTMTALSATGQTAALDLEGVRKTHVIQTVVTGAPTAVSCVLEGSLDNAHWYTLATSTSTTGDAQFAVDKPARYLRGNLGTLTGGTSPTVTVSIGSI